MSMAPRLFSWMWWRDCAIRALGNDWDWRKSIPENIWKKSNVSLSVYQQQLQQHFVEIKGQMLKSHRFFEYKPEGDEDTDPAIPLAQRRLHRRSKDIKLKSTLERATRRAMACGEAVLKSSLVQGSRVKKTSGRILLSDTGESIKTTRGAHVSSNDQWFTPAGANIRALVKDPKITLPVDAAMRWSEKEYAMHEKEDFVEGARYDIIHHFDLVVDPRWPSLSDATYKAHEFAWTMDQIVQFITPMNVNPSNLQLYRDTYTSGGSAKLPQSHSSIDFLGEDDESENLNLNNINAEDKVQGLIRLREEYIKADILDLGSMQTIWMIRDVEKNIPIAYALASDIVLHSDEEHPFLVLKVSEVEDRWYGYGYFRDMYEDIMLVDREKNSIELEIRHSGSAKFMQKRAIKNLVAGGPLHIRSNVWNEFEANANPDEVLHVVTVVPQIAEISAELASDLGRISNRYGLSSPGQETTAGTAGADTATGMAILNKKSNAHVEDRKATLGYGYDAVIESFAKIELANTTEAALAEQMGAEKARTLMDWINKNKDSLADSIETVLANADSAMMLSENQQILAIKQQWNLWSPEYQDIDKSLFEQVLLGLDVKDPKKYLVSLNELQQRQLELQAKQQLAAGVGIQTQQDLPPAAGLDGDGGAGEVADAGGMPPNLAGQQPA